MIVNRKLRELYARVPDRFDCAKGCFECCGDIVDLPAVEAREVIRYARMNGIPIPESEISLRDYMLASMSEDFFRANESRFNCRFLTPDGCAVYPARPLVCRLFGIAAEEPLLYCPHGGKATTTLTKAESDVFFEELQEIEIEYLARARRRKR